MKLKRVFFIGGYIFVLGVGGYFGWILLLRQQAAAHQAIVDTRMDTSILSSEAIALPDKPGDHGIQKAIFLEKPLVIDVAKNEHTLRVYRYGTLEKEYRVNVRAEESDRRVWEDDQTPEGTFSIEAMEQMNGHPWRRWMRLNTLVKARIIYTQAYADGNDRIQQYEKAHGPIQTDEDVKRFNASNPTARLLRGIGIHGGYREDTDWTQGCVALNDHDIDELYEIVQSGPNNGIRTPVLIHD